MDWFTKVVVIPSFPKPDKRKIILKIVHFAETYLRKGKRVLLYMLLL